MDTQQENNILEDIQKKEQRLNINVRIKESLRDKIKSKMESEQKSPDDFFSDMFLAYLKEESSKKGDIDYSSDLHELNSVIKRISTIFQNMLEKNYMQSSIQQEHYKNELIDLEAKLKNEYEQKISKLEKQCEKTTKEYNLITEQAEGLIKDSKELKKTLNLLKSSNEKNEELLNTYKEQVTSLKKHNNYLEKKLSESIELSVLEKTKIEYEKELLQIEKSHQEIIANIRKEYSELQNKYIEAIETKSTSK